MGSYEGAFSAEPAAGGHPRATGGLARPGEPVVGSPTHPVMPNLVMLWEMSPLRGGVRAGARLWARGQRPETHRVAATSNSRLKQQAAICRELHARYKLQVASGYKLHLHQTWP
jgi:hypothetical protein